MQTLADPWHVWTFDDLQKLPADTPPRNHEIVDGALVVSPTPGLWHEFVIARLRRVLDAQLPPDCWISTTFALNIDPTYRVPDLMVLPRPAELSRTDNALPSEVLLVVEVVSPGSRTTDRITKLAEYAAAGIRAYWRIEVEPEVTLTAYALKAGSTRYAELETWGDGEIAVLDNPFPVRIAIDELTP